MSKIKKEHTKYLFVIMLIAVGALVLLMLKPFFRPILTSVILAYVFYPLYGWVNKKIKRKRLSATIVSIFIILLLVIPLVFVLNALTREVYVVYIKSQQLLISGFDIGCDTKTGFVCDSFNIINKLLANEKVLFYLEDSIKKFATYIIEGATTFVFSIPIRILEIFVTFFMVFYLFIDGEMIVKKVRSLLPLKKSEQDYMFKQAKDTTKAIVYGYVVTAIIQGVAGGIGLFIFGIPSPILWTLFMIFFALIPLVGTPIVWIPAAVYLFIKGDILMGVLFLLYNLIIVTNIDNFLRPRLISSRTRVHPVLILLGILGGLVVFGFIGIIVGPLVLGLLYNLVEIYQKEK